MKKNIKPTDSFKIGHTYSPINNKKNDDTGCIVVMVYDIDDIDILKQYRHSENCSLCRAEEKI